MYAVIQISVLGLFLCCSAIVSAQENDESLADQLHAQAEKSAKKFPAEVRETFSRAIETVAATGIEESAKQVGDTAPDAELESWDGEARRLSELWSDGPIVLMWYRGGWCPYCNIQLRAMQKKLAEIEGAGAKLVVLSPEVPEKSQRTVQENNLEMVVLFDKNNQVAREYGIVFELPESIVPIYRDKLKLAEYNGNDAMELPLAATYVINQTGKITYAFLDADYKKRAEPDEVIEAVRKL